MEGLHKIIISVFLVILLVVIGVTMIPLFSQSDPESQENYQITNPSSVETVSVTESVEMEDNLSVEESNLDEVSEEVATQSLEPQEVSTDEAPQTTGTLSGKIICIDAGHGKFSQTQQEAIAPNSEKTKPGNVTGTEGKYQTEEQLNLKVALKLQKLLEEQGATIIMIRTTAECDTTNIERAKKANEAGADLTVRIHANGSEDKSVYGVEMWIPSEKHVTNEVAEKSRMAGEIVLDAVIAETGARNRGFIVTSDLTGFNWSEVPVILLEMGYMTNENEDAQLSGDEYQNKIARGLLNGVVRYFSS